MHKVYWKGISNDNRIKAISEITAVVDKHGTILNFQKFSDLALSLVVELESSRLNSLHNCLAEILTIDEFNPNTSVFTGMTILFLNVTFLKGTGDLELEVPDIPE